MRESLMDDEPLITGGTPALRVPVQASGMGKSPIREFLAPGANPRGVRYPRVTPTS
jgi:hypothetical protein